MSDRRKPKRQPITIRVKDSTRTLIEAAADKSGRSMAEELVWRLEISFYEEDHRVNA